MPVDDDAAYGSAALRELTRQRLAAAQTAAGSAERRALSTRDGALGVIDMTTEEVMAEYGLPDLTRGTMKQGPNAGMRVQVGFPWGPREWDAEFGAKYGPRSRQRAARRQHRATWSIEAHRLLGIPRPRERSIANGTADGVPTYQTTEPGALQRPTFWWVGENAAGEGGRWYSQLPEAYEATVAEMQRLIVDGDRFYRRKAFKAVGSWAVIGLLVGSGVSFVRGLFE